VRRQFELRKGGFTYGTSKKNEQPGSERLRKLGIRGWGVTVRTPAQKKTFKDAGTQKNAVGKATAPKKKGNSGGRRRVHRVQCAKRILSVKKAGVGWHRRKLDSTMFLCIYSLVLVYHTHKECSRSQIISKLRTRLKTYNPS